ncbi:hypothetical protein SCHPADRAFT_901507 [Schizopora paradoxa]|uniref:Uncharacterized protein n=1 Tax=Schizopora paradoxa TaxID=27342 RepID=A0A0H2RXE2_9AGAM|nr:hypothetical protein SCHPADRAFT_901507 [Schizopora paradoxa]
MFLKPFSTRARTPCGRATAYTVYRFIIGTSVIDVHPWAGCVMLAKDHTIFYALIGSVLMDLRMISLHHPVFS